MFCGLVVSFGCLGVLMCVGLGTGCRLLRFVCDGRGDSAWVGCGCGCMLAGCLGGFGVV